MFLALIRIPVVRNEALRSVQIEGYFKVKRRLIPEENPLIMLSACAGHKGYSLHSRRHKAKRLKQ